MNKTSVVNLQVLIGMERWCILDASRIKSALVIGVWDIEKVLVVELEWVKIEKKN